VSRAAYNRPVITRRSLLLRAAAGAAALAAARAGLAAAGDDPAARRKALERPLPRRPLGKTGESVGILGLGTFYLAGLRDAAAAEAIVRRAHDLGVNWFDTAPSYSSGAGEERLGRALKGLRDKVLLATKSTADDGPGAVKELEASLKRLGTDRVDLFQFHAIRTAEEAKAVFGEGGAHEALEKARKAGKVRFLGFTGHYDPEVVAAVARERAVETAMFPLNAIDLHDERSFEATALPAVRERGLGALAMKVFASGKLLDDPARSPSVEECLRYALSLPVAAAVVGCGSVEELDRDLACAKSFEPLTAEERKALLARTRAIAAKKIEWYKK
jgi:predicted aldo/keto reductase-like oxidoreductase